MEHSVIVPWEVNEETDTQYVPEYIVNMATHVLKQYDFQVKGIECVTTKPDKGGAIWRLETNRGPKSLKLLHRRPMRSLFSLGAQRYLVDVKNARVPPIVKTKTGADYVEAGGKLWFVAKWIEPLEPVTKDLEGAKKLCYALGEFHRLTKGYVPPKQAELASRLHKWPSYYKKVIEKMDWFRNVAKVYNDMPASKTLLEVVGQFEEQAKRSYERLINSDYDKLVKHGNEHWGLVHQDYGWSNGQMGPGGMWIIDLDGVAYDLPVRDLSKLISGTMADLFEWKVDWIKEMIDAYATANPIPPDLYNILLIDLSLPMDFYKNMKEVVYEPDVFLNEETEKMIRTIVQTDQTKWPVLKQLERETKAGRRN
ncbi:CotS family spore coat protein [Fervidibacillus albus]|uniref:CotS family spore coat protein n=1 Tax=Fervidibacillus albus TaxID=2980026 RepID=A0A9E8RUQ5_9BACI|nr:CotS family spore coat protein [Fervidibacillus albus]WAA08551.1 CotS family spore coat protein [Fervidibacillus albus]